MKLTSTDLRILIAAVDEAARVLTERQRRAPDPATDAEARP